MANLRTLSGLSFTLLRKTLSIWVRTKVSGNKPEDIGLDPDKPICYVLERRSLSDLLVLEQECILSGLPRPYDDIKSDKISEKRAFFTLRYPDRIRRKQRKPSYSTRMLRLITALEQNPELDIQLVPVSIFWGHSPDKENSTVKLLFSDNWRVAGRIKKIFTILFHGRNTFIQFNESLSLRQLVDEKLEHSHTTRKLGRILRVHFRRVRSAVLGPDLSHRRTLVNALVETPNVLAAVKEEMVEKNIDQYKAEALARKYAYEIASDISYGVIRFFDRFLSWLWNRLYKGISVHHIDKVKETAQDCELIYVPSHRSHMDYLLISYVLYNNGLMLPHIAAGINLNMPIVGPLLRRGGAFFMRRTFKGNHLYTVIFNEYLHTMFIKGFSVEYFIEGGRSRTGRLRQPRMGMLNMTLQSFLRDAKRPIVFVPVYIAYDKVFEARTYLGELRGQEKKKESIFDIFRVVKRLKVSLGRVHVNFGNPISLTKFLNAEKPDWRDEAATQSIDLKSDSRPIWFNDTVEKLALHISTEINKATSVNPINLVALALLSTSKQAMDEKALIERLKTYYELLKANPYSELITLPEGRPDSWIDYVENKMKLITRQNHDLGDLIVMRGVNAVLMTYYRNNIIHLFVVPSLLACFFQNNRQVLKSDILKTCQALYPYLKAELFLPWNEDELMVVIEKWMITFIEMDLLSECENEKLKRQSTSTPEFVMLITLAQATVQTLERYYITLALLQSSENGSLTPEELENKCHLMAERLSILHGFNAPEFFDKSLFKHFIEKLQEKNILTVNEKKCLTYDENLKKLTKQSKTVLSPDVRHSILQVTHLN